MSQTVQYNPPFWAPQNPSEVKTLSFTFALEVIKSGTIVGYIPFKLQASEKDKENPTLRSYLKIGKLAEFNDIEMAHDSISREHAIIQVNKLGRFFLFDLGSTYGTKWNRKRVKPFTYVPLRLGDQLVFGESSRSYVVGVENPEQREAAEDFEKNIKDQITMFLENKKKEQEMEKQREEKDKVTLSKLKAHLLKSKKKSDDLDEDDENPSSDPQMDFDDESSERKMFVSDSVSLFEEEQSEFNDLSSSSSFSSRKRKGRDGNEDDENDGPFQKRRKLENHEMDDKAANLSLIELQERRESLQQELLKLNQALKEYNRAQKMIEMKESSNSKNKNEEQQKEDQETDSLDSFMSNIHDMEKKGKENKLKKMTQDINTKEKEIKDLDSLILKLTPSISSLKSSSDVEKDKEKLLSLEFLSPNMFIKSPEAPQPENQKQVLTKNPKKGGEVINLQEKMAEIANLNKLWNVGGKK